MSRIRRPARQHAVIAAAGAAALLLPLTIAPVAHAATPAPDAPAAAQRVAEDAGPIGGAQLASKKAVAGTGDGVAPLPAFTAQTWLLADAESGEVLAAQGAHVLRPPASTLKTLTALTLLPKLGPADTYRPIDADVRVSGSKVGLMVGAEYTNDQLFTALFLPSANDAAGALARSNGGMTRTLAQMQEVADGLQANDTTVKNPSGLDAEGQLSSAYDLALIARAGLELPEFRRYASTVRADFPGKSLGGGKRATFEVQNQNPLLTSYRGAIGVKTGFTTKAGRTFVGAAERNGRTLIVTLMGIGQPTRPAATALLDWGFANADRITEPVGTLVEPTASQAAEPVEDLIAAGPVNDPGTSTSRRIASVLAAIAVIAGTAMVGIAIANSDALTRRRIRKRYR